MRLVLVLSMIVGCSPAAEEPADVADGTSDADPDADTDTDTDTDTDADSDADTDTVPVTVDVDGDGFAGDVDCDDADADVFPGALERCGDGRISDCDRTDEDGLVTVDGDATFDDLADALAAAVDGSEVAVCAGTWTGAFTASVPVRLVGVAAAEATVLDADGAGTVLTVPGGSSVEGLTLTRGRGEHGGGLAITGGGISSVLGCTITENRAELGGGVWLDEGSGVAVLDSTIDANDARLGGGLYASPTAILDLGGTTISANRANLGGGLYAFDASVTDGVISANTADGQSANLHDPSGGGGVFAAGSATVRSTVISDNTTLRWTGGAGVSASAGPLTLIDVTISGNTAPEGFGGGVSLYAPAGHTRLVLDGGVVEANTALLGGGVYLENADLDGGELTGNAAVSIGFGSDDFGGGVFVRDGTLADVVLRANVAGSGGGAYLQEDVAIVRCTFDANTAARGAGAEFDVGGNVVAPIVDSTFTGNIASGVGGALRLHGDYQAMIAIDGSTFADNGAVFGGGLQAYWIGVRIADSAFVRNDDHALYVIEGAEISVQHVDFGTGADANVPADVSSIVGGSSAWGADASFTCDDDDGCIATP